MSEAVAEVRLAVWGAGGMGERVARSAAKLPSVVVTAVIDVDIDRARIVADAVGGQPYGSVAEACGGADVDAIYIGLPNAAHRDACLDVAKRGLHVLIDKPLTTTIADADEVLKAASASPGFWMMGFSSRFRSEWRRAREILQEGGIGQPYFVSDNVIEAYRSTPEWYWDSAVGGGVLNLQSHHVFDRWEWLLGTNLTEISAQRFIPLQSDTDLSVVLNARLGSSMAGSSALSFGIGYDSVPRISFTIQGTLGMIEIDEARRLTVFTESGVIEEQHDGDDWLSCELSDFVSGVRGVQLGQPTLADGRRAVELAEAAALSSSTGDWISTDPGTVGLDSERVHP